MARRRGEREQERQQGWQEVIAQWGASGQSVAAFCRERKIAQGTFYAGRRRLGGKRRPAFLPVRVSADADPGSGAAAIEIALASGKVVRVRPGFDPATLGRVLAVAEGRPC